MCYKRNQKFLYRFIVPKKKIDEVPLEEYVVGVVAAEMPAEFEKEALKAQALAARTYIVKELFTGQNVGSPKGAVVTDTELHQVYKNEEELRRIWKKDFDWKIKKIKEAVAETRGQILTYDDKPIDASFFQRVMDIRKIRRPFGRTPFLI